MPTTSDIAETEKYYKMKPRQSNIDREKGTTEEYIPVDLATLRHHQDEMIKNSHQIHISEFNKKIADILKNENWTMRNGETIYFTMPKIAVLRSWSFNHLYHHRGQLTVYLRLLGVAVPGMYGPTADDQMM